MSNTLRKKRKLKSASKNEQSFQQANQQSFGDNQPNIHGNQLSQTLNKQLNKPKNRKVSDSQMKNVEVGSGHKIKAGDQQTMGESVDGSLPKPYQFLLYANPPLHTIFVPHFKLKSINFGLSILFVICFIILIAFSSTRTIQNQKTWNCSLFYLQNKYYPRLRYDYQFWRAIISPFFHSNIAHFVLNLLSLQIYGYFIEWYYGKLKYCLTAIFAVLFSFFFSCAAQPTSISTNPSAILYAILALKIIFFYEYRDYKPLIGRRIFLYLLFGLIFGINIIPVLVNNNVDFTTLIAGFITGLFMGVFYHLQKSQQQLSNLKKALKFGSLIMLFIGLIICIAISFALEDENGNYQYMNDTIVNTCEKSQ